MRGSLIERYIRCGKPGCKCADTPGHGPKYYLSVSYPGRRPEQEYVPQKYRDRVKAFLVNYQTVKQIFEEISSTEVLAISHTKIPHFVTTYIVES